MGQDRCADVQCRQLVRHGPAFARQYRGVHVRGNGAQEAAHSSRLACASVLHRRRTTRSDSLLRLLAQGRRQRRHERAAGKACLRQGGNAFEWRSEHEWPLARTRWTKFYLDLSQPAEDRAGVTGMLTTTKPANIASRTYAASSLGSMGSTSAASSQVMGGGIKPGMGISLETPPLAADTE